MTQPEALRLADMLENNYPLEPEAEEAAAGLRRLHEENEHLRQALLQPGKHLKFEGAIHVVCQCDKCKAQPEWVGLTRRELDIATLGLEDLSDCYKAIEAKLKEKNT